MDRDEVSRVSILDFTMSEATIFRFTMGSVFTKALRGPEIVNLRCARNV